MPAAHEAYREAQDDVDWVTMKCHWHCILCGRHFADEKSFKNHYTTPGNFGGCRRPPGTNKFDVLVDEFGICGTWSNFSHLPEWRETPRRDVRVYYTEDL